MNPNKLKRKRVPFKAQQTIMNISNATSFYVPSFAEFVSIGVSIIFNTFLGMTWFDKIFGNRWMQLVCEDKGITGKSKKVTMEEFKKAAQTRWPYPDQYCYVSSFICNLVKSWFLIHWFHILHVASISDVISICLCWSTIYLVSLHHYFWQGQRVELMAINATFELTSFLGTGILVSLIPKMMM